MSASNFGAILKDYMKDNGKYSLTKDELVTAFTKHGFHVTDENTGFFQGIVDSILKVTETKKPQVSVKNPFIPLPPKEYELFLEVIENVEPTYTTNSCNATSSFYNLGDTEYEVSEQIVKNGYDRLSIRHRRLPQKTKKWVKVSPSLIDKLLLILEMSTPVSSKYYGEIGLESIIYKTKMSEYIVHNFVDTGDSHIYQKSNAPLFDTFTQDK